MEEKKDLSILPNKKQKNEKRQEQFDKNRDVKTNTKKEENSGKILFDKQLYRIKKYSNKYKLHQWDEQRKKKLIREYQKDVKNEPVGGTYKPKGFDEDTTDSNEDVGKYVRHPDIIEKYDKNIKPKRVAFQKAKDQFDRVKEDKVKKRAELEKIVAERNKKLEEYKKTKRERFKKISKKTKKGQPFLTGSLELLLEKIQKN